MGRTVGVQRFFVHDSVVHFFFVVAAAAIADVAAVDAQQIATVLYFVII